MFPPFQIPTESSVITLLSVLGALATVLMAYLTYRKRFPSELRRRVESLEQRMAKQEQLHNEISMKIAVMATNIEWLKENAKTLTHALGVQSPDDPQNR